MQTTAGSLALVNSKVPADATVVSRLRDAGAVILGKANLGEWANFAEAGMVGQGQHVPVLSQFHAVPPRLSGR
jgi:Asp-tRNA(Asn)/Glu-tRNA(Gln) amidotransferase A subunit family amidase